MQLENRYGPTRSPVNTLFVHIDAIEIARQYFAINILDINDTGYVSP